MWVTKHVRILGGKKSTFQIVFLDKKKTKIKNKFQVLGRIIYVNIENSSVTVGNPNLLKRSCEKEMGECF